MKNILYLFLLLLISCSKVEKPQSNQKPLVAVSIPSYLFFVEKIAENTVEVKNLIPAGADPHHFEPTPQHLDLAIKASLWFRSAEHFEKEFLNLILPYNQNLQVCDLTENIPLIEEDLHLWLSPKIAILQAEKIASVLEKNFPKNKQLYQKNLKKLIKEIHKTDLEIQTKLKSAKNRTILVSHKAFSYFCADYGLKQISIENGNQEPNLKTIYHIFNEAKKDKVKKVFIQAQADNKGALLIAKELNVSPFMVDPYSADYLKNLKKIADIIADNNQE